MELTKQQSDGIKKIKAWFDDPDIHKSQVFRLFGYAGTGKTTLAKELQNVINGKVLYATFTGKAALVLHSKGCFGASTIHSLIYKANEDPVTGKIEWIVNHKTSPLYDASLLVVDEVSMVGDEQCKDLLSFGVPIVVLGDPFQLPPIEGESWLTNGAEPDHMMTDIRRQTQESPIIRMSMQVREKGYLDEGDWGDGCLVTTERDLSDELYNEGMLEFNQILCGKNDTRQHFNEMVREAKGLGAKMDAHYPVVGDKLICLKNNRNKGLLNGSLWKVDSYRDQTKAFSPLVVSSLDQEGVIPVDVNVPVEFWKGREKDLDWKVKRMYDEFTYGYAMTVHKCVHPDTIVETAEGLLPIKHVANSGKIATLGGQADYKNKVVNPVMESLKFSTGSGYGAIVTTDHKVEVFRGGEWVLIEAKELVIDDWMRLKLGVSCDSSASPSLPPARVGYHNEKVYKLPETMTPELAEFFGLMVADGSCFEKGFRLAKRHSDVLHRFSELVGHLFGYECNDVLIGKTLALEVCSTFIRRWLTDIGGMEPNSKSIPLSIMQSSSDIQRSFIKGLFEDACVNVKDGKVDHIQFVSVSESVVKWVQVALLRYGIVSSTVQRNGCHSLYIYGVYCSIYRDKIGFVSSMKQQRLVNCRDSDKRSRVPVSPDGLKELKSRLSPGVYAQAQKTGYLSKDVWKTVTESCYDWHYEKVTSIETTACISMCVEVPSTGRFLQNGFPHSNSQGSQWNSVFLWDQSSVFREKRLNHLYTAVTRAANRVVVVTG